MIDRSVPSGVLTGARLGALGGVQAKSAGTPIDIRLRTAGGWRLVEVLGSRYDDEHLVVVSRNLTERSGSPADALHRADLAMLRNKPPSRERHGERAPGG